MATLLKDLIITKVALVDEGSCSDAHIKLYKRKSKGGNEVMTFEEIIKSLPTDQQSIVNAELAKAKEQLPEGAMSAEDAKKLSEEKAKAEGELAKMKAPTKSQDPEELLKSANLDPAVKAIVESVIAKSAANEAIVKKMKDEQETAELISKAKNLDAIPAADTEVLDFLKSIKGVDGAVDKAVTILQKANDLVKKGAALGELGTGGGTGPAVTEAEAWAKIEKAADEVAKSQNITKSKAVQVVMETNPQLYKEYTTALKGE